MKTKYIDNYGIIWTKSVIEGYVFCRNYGYGLYNKGEGLTLLNQ